MITNYYLSAFDAQVELRPDVRAVVYGNAALTYRALQDVSSALGHSLAAAGVGRDDVTAIYANRGIEFLAGMLGVFRTGGAYMPVDPAYPPQRVAHMLRQSRARCVLVEDALRAPFIELCAQAQIPVPQLLTLETRTPAGPAAHAHEKRSPEDLAYVIFTSGSTGRPKGAMVEHRSMMNHLSAKLHALSIGPGDRVLQNAPQCFDISVWQFLCPLLVGAEVHIVPDAVAQEPREIIQYVQQQRITIAEMVPSFLRTVLEQLESEPVENCEFAALRWLLVTGEALHPQLCRQWLARFPSIPLVNAYGPTECADDVTHHVVSRPPADDAVRIPIGLPVQNVRLYVVEEKVTPLRQCAVGVPGELCVAGVAVGRGYINDEAATQRAFLADPFAHGIEQRLYRTGDLVRQRPDGTFEFLGRIDRQVKIAGVRIELEEIEYVLRQYAGVHDCAVLAVPVQTPAHRVQPGSDALAAACEVAGSSAVLAAYVVGLNQPAVADLRVWLQGQLPSQMVPPHIVALDRLPTTPNGKLDVQALPAVSMPAKPAHRPAGTPEEHWLVGVWCDKLNLRGIGVDDDFFALGGNSMAGARILHDIGRHKGVRLTFTDLMNAPTVAQLARAVAARTQQRISSDSAT